jgi:cell division protein FtsW (lipid II flippase)
MMAFSMVALGALLFFVSWVGSAYRELVRWPSVLAMMLGLAAVLSAGLTTARSPAWRRVTVPTIVAVLAFVIVASAAYAGVSAWMSVRLAVFGGVLLVLVAIEAVRRREAFRDPLRPRDPRDPRDPIDPLWRREARE